MKRLKKLRFGKPAGYDIDKFYQQYTTSQLADKAFYNIGAGSFSHPCWTNVDFASEHYQRHQQANFIHYDLTALEPLPITDNSAEIIYSSHTVEHVNDAAVENLLAHAYRALKPGGCIRLTMPDAELEYLAYARNDRLFFDWIDRYQKKDKWRRVFAVSPSKVSLEQVFISQVAGQLSQLSKDNSSDKLSDDEIKAIFQKNPQVEALDLFCKRCSFNPDFPGQHMNWWSETKLRAFLQKAGFTKVYRSGYGQSLLLPLRDTRYFDSTRPRISLYMEAFK